ncbi:MAG: DUF6048 family protein [Alloprevotella sp.]
MRTWKTLGFICALLCAEPLWASPASGHCSGVDGRPEAALAADSNRVQVIQYHSREEAAAALRKRKYPLLAGISVSGDLCGAAMYALTDWGQLEAACRINLKHTYFPVFEMGIGRADKVGETTDVGFRTSAPFFRIGCDYNMLRNKTSGYRLLVGLRYGFSSFDFDVSGPDIVDPVTGAHTPLCLENVQSKAGWAELCFGLETKIWTCFRLGWNFRYKLRLSQDISPYGEAWYIPGYGKNDGHALGGTFNVVLDF